MIKEQLELVRVLRGPEFDRKRHGSLFDRGSADSYYDRAPNPHYGGSGGEFGFEEIRVTHAASVAEYLAGYEHNEQSGLKKEYQ